MFEFLVGSDHQSCYFNAFVMFGTIAANTSDMSAYLFIQDPNWKCMTDEKSKATGKNRHSRRR